MRKILVHIEPKEIEYIGTSVSAEHILPSIDAYTDYRDKTAETKVITPGNFVDLGAQTYNAFYFSASDYVLVSKYYRGMLLSEISTKFIFEIVDNSDYDIQVTNTSSDDVRISWKFYNDGSSVDYTIAASMSGTVGTSTSTLVLNHLTNTDNLQIQDATQPIAFSTLKTMRVVNHSVNNTVTVHFNSSLIIIPAAQEDAESFIQLVLPDLDVTAQSMQIYTSGADPTAQVDIFLVGE